MARKGTKKKKTPLWIKLCFLITAIIVADLSWFMFVVDIKKYEKKNPEKTAFMKYREHQWEKNGRNVKIKKTWVSLNRISENVRRAVVVAEDAKFWKHEGFDVDALKKAVEKNIKKRKLAVGASTITMQVAKNLFLSPSKTPVRKIHEAILTWRIEKTLSKRRILELYLNIAEWGDGIFGIEMASRTYFGHSAASLDKRESALLAAVLPNPIRFNPLKNSRFVARRSRLIRRALGGDIDAAMALHIIPAAQVTDDKDTVQDDDMVKNTSVDSSEITHGETSDSSEIQPAAVNDTLVVPVSE